LVRCRAYGSKEKKKVGVFCVFEGGGRNRLRGGGRVPEDVKVVGKKKATSIGENEGNEEKKSVVGALDEKSPNLGCQGLGKSNRNNSVIGQSLQQGKEG